MSEATEFRQHFSRHSPLKSTFKTYAATVFCYRGASTNPRWIDVDRGQFFLLISSVHQYELAFSPCTDIFLFAAENYSRLCDVEADLSTMTLIPLSNPAGGTYYRVEYDIVLSFGLTELKAQIAWRDEKVRCLLF